MRNLGNGREPADESLLAGVADEYVARLRRGECPTVEEYARRHPELAAQLREMLPTLQAMQAAHGLASEGAGELEEWLEDRTLGD